MKGIVFQGLVATIAGMGIVFITLLIISAVLNQMEKIEKLANKIKVSIKNLFKAEKAEEIIKIKEADEIVEIEETNINDDLELVAVITAVIAASLNTSNDKLQVRTIRRVNKTKSAWNESGRQERIQSSLY